MNTKQTKKGEHQELAQLASGASPRFRSFSPGSNHVIWVRNKKKGSWSGPVTALGHSNVRARARGVAPRRLQVTYSDAVPTLTCLRFKHPSSPRLEAY